MPFKFQKIQQQSDKFRSTYTLELFYNDGVKFKVHWCADLHTISSFCMSFRRLLDYFEQISKNVNHSKILAK